MLTKHQSSIPKYLLGLECYRGWDSFQLYTLQDSTQAYLFVNAIMSERVSITCFAPHALLRE